MPDEQDLLKVIQAGRAIIVAGTGVTAAATVKDGVPHKHATWLGLLESGLTYLVEEGHMRKNIAKSHKTLLADKSARTHRYISTAQDITEALGGNTSTLFAKWIQEAIGDLHVTDERILIALDRLRKRGNMLATTNYDNVLRRPGVTRQITWADHDDILACIRVWDTSAVIHLHGHVADPSKIILDWSSYDQIARNASYRKALEAFWLTHTWVYVGCGTSGLSDPDFGLLLERYGPRARASGRYDFCLVKTRDVQEFQAHFDKMGFNIKAIAFGDNNSDLPTYLERMVSTAVSADDFEKLFEVVKTSLPKAINKWTRPSPDNREHVDGDYLYRIALQQIVHAATKLYKDAVRATVWTVSRLTTTGASPEPGAIRSEEREGHYLCDQFLHITADSVLYREKFDLPNNNVNQKLPAATECLTETSIPHIVGLNGGFDSEPERSLGTTHIVAISCTDNWRDLPLRSIVSITIDLVTSRSVESLRADTLLTRRCKEIRALVMGLQSKFLGLLTKS